MFWSFQFFGFVAACFISAVIAHPGESHSHADIRRGLTIRDFVASAGKRSLDACSNSLTARKRNARAVARRAKKVKELRRQRGIKTSTKKSPRDISELEAWEDVNHNMTGIDNYNIFSPEAEVFSANTSCILAPEVTSGPFYVLGEYVRSNVKEANYCDGVDLHLEVQYVDINTCEGVPNVAIELWNANATGTYSGIVFAGNAYVGANYAADGWNSTYLRGSQLTDHDGVVIFETIFPGHYRGRATHTHLLAHSNATLEPNGTISVWNAPVTHMGQLFWDTALRDAVEATYPYSTNTIPILSNDNDMWAPLAASADYDPFPQWLYLGEKVEDGLFAWIQIGINVTADFRDNEYYVIDGYLDADGVGHEIPNPLLTDISNSTNSSSSTVAASSSSA